MASDWQIGDLALRVKPTNVHAYFGALPGHELPQEGRTYEVEGIAVDGGGNLGLILRGAHSAHPLAPAWRAESFRKIRPDAHEACEEEFVTLLKRKKVSA